MPGKSELERFTLEGARLLIEPLGPPEKSPGGVLLPQTAKTKGASGKVLKCERDTFGGRIVPGDTVHHPEYIGTNVKLDGRDLIVLKAEDVCGCVKAG